IPYIALKAARAALEADRLDAAEYWFERALDSDPNGSSALTEAAGFYAQIRDAERVYDLVDRFESLRSSNPGAWQAIARIHESMGDDAEVDRARLCATVDEEGCWGED
ncbi:MAG: hypothetical protein QF638_08760, partial [Acidimicrobiales bacterium]|nr:hypothetical protein [Acidimicrobiales bacterium]